MMLDNKCNVKICYSASFLFLFYSHCSEIMITFANKNNKEMKTIFNFNELTSEEVLDAVKTLTDGTYETPLHSSTLVGYSKSYDRYGRPLHANPNRIVGTVCIEGLNYKVVKRGFNVEIYREDITKERDWSNPNFCEEIFAKRDITPQYIKDYKTTKTVTL